VGIKARMKRLAMLADLFTTLGNLGYHENTLVDTVDLNKVLHTTYLSKSQIFKLLDFAQEGKMLNYKPIPDTEKVEITLDKYFTKQLLGTN
jgi:hypothetical protein